MTLDKKLYADAVREVSEEFDADILVYSGPLFPPDDIRLVGICRKRKIKRKNLILILTTPGGSADVAYRIARCLQRAYRTYDNGPDQGELIIYVHHWCKSAGTILCLGGDKIIMSQLAELGPIDVQLRKEDEVGDWTSGLTALEALNTLQQQAAGLFLKQFREMRFGRDTRFSTRVATDVASDMAVGLLQPIYGQIDPMRLGEIERFVRISVEYSDRLATDNVLTGTVEKLVVGYPSHGFIIDRREARTLFRHVDKPNDQLEFIGEFACMEAHQNEVLTGENDNPIMRFENDEEPKNAKQPKRRSKAVGRRASRSGTSKSKRSSGTAARNASTAQESQRTNGTGRDADRN